MCLETQNQPLSSVLTEKWRKRNGAEANGLLPSTGKDGCAGVGGALESRAWRHFLRKVLSREEAFYNGAFTAWSQRWGRKILKLFDHFGYHCTFSNPNSWPKKAEDFPGLVLHPSEPESLRPFFALLGNVCLSAVRTYIGCVIIQTWRGCFLASAALIAAGGAVEK